METKRKPASIDGKQSKARLRGHPQTRPLTHPPNPPSNHPPTYPPTYPRTHPLHPPIQPTHLLTLSPSMLSVVFGQQLPYVHGPGQSGWGFDTQPIRSRYAVDTHFFGIQAPFGRASSQLESGKQVEQKSTPFGASELPAEGLTHD